MANIKQTKPKNASEDADKKESLYTVGPATMEISMKFPQKAINGTTI
jgi:hypothetical protein